MQVEIHYRRLFWDSISGEVQSLLRVLEKPTVTALSHLFAGLKLPTMEKKSTKIELRSFASQNPKIDGIVTLFDGHP